MISEGICKQGYVVVRNTYTLLYVYYNSILQQANNKRNNIKLTAIVDHISIGLILL